MYILRKPVAILGMGIGAISTVICPFLRVPIKGNWNLYQTDMSLFIITMGILGFAMLFFVLRKLSLFRMMSLVYFIWTIVGLAAVFFKINNYFGMKIVDGLFAKTLHLKWGWAVLIVSALIMIFSVQKVKEIK